MNNSITCLNMTHIYESATEQLPIVTNLNWSVAANDTVAIIGESGVGKSTLLHILGLLMQPTAGQLTLLDEPVSSFSLDMRSMFIRRHIGFVFQFFQLFNDMTVWQNLYYTGCYLMPEKEAAYRAEELLKQTGIWDRREYIATQLSGGEKQRLAIARALIKQPALLFADEPTGNLDESHAQAILDLLFSYRKDHPVTMVLVTHNREIAQRCNTVYEMKHKQLTLAGGAYV